MAHHKNNAEFDFFKSETGGVKKKWKDKLPIALLFPNYYHVGMSNLGFQLVYELANSFDDIVCERIFLPEQGAHPVSVESNRPLRDFPIVFVSISFETDFLSLLSILKAGSISILARDRQVNESAELTGNPLVIAGGVATFINPEPLTCYADMLVVGEAEAMLPQLLELLLQKLRQCDRKTLLLDAARSVPGCYVPSLYDVDYKDDGTIKEIRRVVDDIPERIRKQVHGGTDSAGHSGILTPRAEFADIYLTELGRGCSRGCRFCAAGFVYRPPRLWDAKQIIRALEEKPLSHNRIGLLGMEMARPDDLLKVSKFLLRTSCILSFSSLRADILDENLLDLLKRSGLKTATIAPDGGSERLRNVINKGITEDDVITAATALATIGIKNLKLYFMIGLPTETFDDMAELCRLVDQIRTAVLPVGRSRGSLMQLHLSINCFVPKAWTPFQFHPFEDVSGLKKKIQYLRSKLSGLPNLKMVVEKPEKALWQAVLARGDRRLGIALRKIGDTRKWQKVLSECGLSAHFYAGRQRDLAEILPWDIIDHGIDRRYLWQEYQKGLAARRTPSCKTGGCKKCGVCHG